MNKRLYLPIVFILLGAFLLSGCGFQMVTGSGKVVSESRQVADFSAVTLEGIGNVYITQADTTSVKIEAEDNLIPYFETSISGSTLTIGIKHEYLGVSFHPTIPIKFYVSTPNVDALTLAGSGNIITTDLQANSMHISLLGSGNITNETLKADTVDVSLAGSGNIDLGTVTATSVSSTIAGSGDITLAGETSTQSIHIVGSGNYKASDLKSADANVNVTGSGNSQVYATGTLRVTITGSGDVRYHGNPSVNTSITGSGHVTSND